MSDKTASKCYLMNKVAVEIFPVFEMVRMVRQVMQPGSLQ